jgi:polyphosphate glucokinase
VFDDGGPVPASDQEARDVPGAAGEARDATRRPDGASTAGRLGIDVGGSGIKAAPVDLETGELTAERCRIETPDPATPDAVADVVARIVDRFDDHRGPIGCTFPAVVKNGVVLTASNVDDDWLGVDAAELFARRCDREFTVLNDADAAGVAEIRFGAGRGHDGVVAMVTLGTGIGSSLFSDGVLVPNTELGNVEIGGHEAEHRASARAMDEKDLSWDDWSRWVEEYLHSLQRLVWPDLIIIGGGVSEDAEKFLSGLDLRCPVVPARLGNQAGLVGAALVASGA